MHGRQPRPDQTPIPCSFLYITLLGLTYYCFSNIQSSYHPLHGTDIIPVIFIWSLSRMYPPFQFPTALTRATQGPCFIHIYIWGDPTTCLLRESKLYMFFSCKLFPTHAFEQYIIHVHIIWEEGISSMSQVEEWKIRRVNGLFETIWWVHDRDLKKTTTTTNPGVLLLQQHGQMHWNDVDCKGCGSEADSTSPSLAQATII